MTRNATTYCYLSIVTVKILIHSENMKSYAGNIDDLSRLYHCHWSLRTVYPSDRYDSLL